MPSNRIRILLCKLISLWSKAITASAGDENARPSPGSPSRSVVRKNSPMIMSSVGMVTGRPSDGLRMLLVDSIRIRASAWASADSGRGTALWSPAKTALHGELLPVEVGVERRAEERVDLDRLALDQLGLEGLDAEPVQGGCPVEQHRVLGDDLLEHVPDHGVPGQAGRRALDHPLGGLDVLAVRQVDQPLHHERLEQVPGPLLGEGALVEGPVRAGDDDRPTGVVEALAEQVLTEAPLLALEHVGQRLQRPVARPRDRTTTA